MQLFCCAVKMRGYGYIVYTWQRWLAMTTCFTGSACKKKNEVKNRKGKVVGVSGSLVCLGSGSWTCLLPSYLLNGLQTPLPLGPLPPSPLPLSYLFYSSPLAECFSFLYQQSTLIEQAQANSHFLNNSRLDRYYFDNFCKLQKCHTIEKKDK